MEFIAHRVLDVKWVAKEKSSRPRASQGATVSDYAHEAMAVT